MPTDPSDWEFMNIQADIHTYASSLNIWVPFIL